MGLSQGPGLSQGNAINVRPSAHLDQLHTQASDTVTTTAFEEIFTYTATADSTRILQLECSASTFGHYRIKVGATVVRERYTTGQEPTANFIFLEARTLANGGIISVEFKASRFIAGVASHTTFTSMEGYIGL